MKGRRDAFEFSLFVMSLPFLLIGCASQKISGVPLNSDLGHISEVCVVQAERGFSDVLSDYLADRRIPHRVVPAFGPSKEKCEFRLESSYTLGHDIKPFVTEYRLQAIEDNEVVAEVRVFQPNNADLGKFYSDDLVVTAADAIGLGMIKIGSVDVEVYNIDTLRVTTEKLKTNICASGGVHKIILEGTISPDSSFAMEKLLKRSPHCGDKRGQVIVATTVQLESGGGYLVDGYKLGRSLRKAGATTVIENNERCASSCAVAFLGGKKRVVEDTGAIMFHAPYISGKNAYGEKVIDCDIPKSDLKLLNDYFIEMVGKEAGGRLYERTMWYCSAEDGWLITGGSAAELYDIATEK